MHCRSHTVPVLEYRYNRCKGAWQTRIDNLRDGRAEYDIGHHTLTYQQGATIRHSAGIIRTDETWKLIPRVHPPSVLFRELELSRECGAGHLKSTKRQHKNNSSKIPTTPTSLGDGFDWRHSSLVLCFSFFNESNIRGDIKIPNYPRVVILGAI